ncbi:enoyl-CoA delta isomerase 1, mitochondrial-like [Anthonomus grandis grandis]|uniref:enoyl-CoA delta isomerase 1, mitochondrial-like n=1 Tax=Anthonomus grandis grandis TaxID=2921223 RepID=UPI002165BE8C|nr:enoyl-CoA delta isomerase 1, mitochondrial-like [Anthonomus grandis grandis]
MSLANNMTRRLASTVNVEINKKGVALLTMRRPPVNSLNSDLLGALKITLNDLEKERVAGAILTSALKTFSAGLDLTVLYKPHPEKVKELWNSLQDAWIALYSSSFPTVAVINGPAPAGGSLLPMCCDYRLIVPKAYLGLSETRLGLISPPLFAATMINIIGRRHSELALTAGKLFSSEEALNVGLVDEIVASKEEGLDKGYDFLQGFKDVSPWGRNRSKQMLRGRTLRNMVEGREEDLKGFVEMVQRQDVQQYIEDYLNSLKKTSQDKSEIKNTP